MNRYLSQGRVRQILAMVIVMLFFAFATVDTWGETRIILLPTDQYFPYSYFMGTNWNNQLGFDPIFEGKVAFYKERGFEIEWDEELQNFVVPYYGDVFRRQNHEELPNRWRLLRTGHGYSRFPRCAWFSWWSTFERYQGPTSSGGGRGRERVLRYTLDDAVSYYSTRFWNGNPVFAVADPGTLPVKVYRQEGFSDSHEYNGIVITSHQPRPLENPNQWRNYIESIPADLRRIKFPGPEREKFVPGISERIHLPPPSYLTVEFEDYVAAVQESNSRLASRQTPCRQSDPSTTVLPPTLAVVPPRESFGQRAQGALRANMGYATRLSVGTAIAIGGNYLEDQIIANNPEMRENLAACAEVQYNARQELWRPRENDEGFWEYQWRKIVSIIHLNAEAVGTNPGF